MVSLATSLYESEIVLELFDMYSNGRSPEAKDQDFGSIPRLSNGIERFFITDINNPAASAAASSSIPVIWDEIGVYGGATTFNHVPGGGNCVYMDGHAEWLPLHSKYPANFTGILMSLVF